METNEKSGDLDFMYRVVLSGWMGISLTILTITQYSCIHERRYLDV